MPTPVSRGGIALVSVEDVCHRPSLLLEALPFDISLIYVWLRYAVTKDVTLTLPMWRGVVSIAVCAFVEMLRILQWQEGYFGVQR